MVCQKCLSDRLLSIGACCNDRFTAEFKDQDYGPDYIPRDFGFAINQDNIRLTFCLECGQIQGNFPEDDPEFYNDCDHEWEENFEGYEICIECGAHKGDEG